MLHKSLKKKQNKKKHVYMDRVLADAINMKSLFINLQALTKRLCGKIFVFTVLIEVD